MEQFLRRPIFYMLAGSLLLAEAFCREKENRRVKGFRIGILSGLFLLGLFLDYCLVDTTTASTVLEAPICLLLVFLYCVIAAGEAASAAFLDTIWCFLLTDLSVQVSFRAGDLFPFRGLPFPPGRLFLFAALMLLLFLAVRKFLSPQLRKEERRKAGAQNVLFGFLILFIYLLGANFQFIVWLMDYIPEGASPLITVFRMIVTGACLSLLALQNSISIRQETEMELNMQKNLWRERQNQFELSQENMDLINRKCHDLRHQISAIRLLKDQDEIDRQMEEMERAVLIYDSAFQTGDETLDTILTEKKLLCEDKGITMTCMAEGKSLGFINKVDLYTMLGNALDNAMESVSKLEDAEKRIIQIAVYQEGSLVMIRVRNYYEDELVFDGNLPVTGKAEKDYHGFGLKSIRHTAEKYGGSILIKTEDSYFTLQILIPIE